MFPLLTPPWCECVLYLLTAVGLHQAEHQLLQLTEVGSEKQQADEITMKISSEAEQATAGDAPRSFFMLFPAGGGGDLV